ncbi:MAG: F0F1 ATP synthase subunit gamma, partial [Candidatus Omnitrophica bacterium]|nr:F0F1 ATP synthase subunit gamma [Candidatus Omnitrophota bacterium]
KVVDEASSVLIDLFMARKVGEVHVASTHFSPSLRHTAAVWKLLNIEFSHKNIKRQSYLYEPGAPEILEDLIRRYCAQIMRVALLEAFTAEHSARMLSMKMATDNVEELIGVLELMRNKARQAAITTEVLEITQSAEALKG